MADLIQITTPVVPKDYGQSQNHRHQDVQQNPTGQVFDLGNQMQVVKTNDRGGDNAEQNLKDEGAALVKTSSEMVKNPSSALDAARSLISKEAINLIRETGDEEAIRKITEFASEVMLSPASLAPDMAAQQKNSTIFGDKIWNVLKNIIDTAGEPMPEAEAAKAPFSLFSALGLGGRRDMPADNAAQAAPNAPQNMQEEQSPVQGGQAPVRENIPPEGRNPLQGQTDPSEMLGAADNGVRGAQMNQAAQTKVTAQGYRPPANGGVFTDDFVDVKEFEAAVADFAKAAVDISSKDEILRSLSANFRYLATEAAPSKAVSEELAAAAKALSGADAQTNFTALKPTLLKLIGYTEHSLLLDDDTKNLLPLIVHSMSRYSDNPDALRDSFDSLLMMSENIKLPPEKMAQLGLDPKLSMPENLEKLFDDFVLKNEYIAPETKQQLLFSTETASHEAQMRSSVTLLAAGAKHMAARIPEGTMASVLSTVDFSSGAEALEKVLSAVIPNTPAMRNAVRSIFEDLENSRDLDVMVDRLNTILENIEGDSDENMIKLAQGLNNALGEMVKSGAYKVSTPTSMETLSDFLTKNINSSFLHALSGATRSDMVQNMLTAPGVFTPLLHQFVPLDAFGLRAFGEMWVDPNAEELIENNKRGGAGSAGEAGTHMFLCFDIEDTGYFELEIYEKDKNMSVMLLCPDKLAGVFEPIRGTIPKIAAENGYHVTASVVGAVREKRSLDRVFPKINAQRSGLNVKV